MSIMVLQSNAAMVFTAQKLRSIGLSVTDQPNTDVDHLLLPVPSFPGGSKYITPVLESLPPDVTISGGNLDHPAVSGYKTIDFLQDPLYLAKNAAITADCALSLVKREWTDLPVLVLGWGRIGKCLGQKLQSLNADVTIAARKAEDLAIIQALGAKSISIDAVFANIMEYQIIFNTIPQMVLPNLQFHPNCIAIELASTPGMSGDKIISARGLPGKYAPERSGALIAETFARLTLRKEDTL